MGSQSHYRGLGRQSAIIKEDKSIIIKPINLDIIWGNDSRYWRLPNGDNGPVELLQVSWLEVTGSLNLNELEPKTYKVSFTASLRPDAFGWKGSPVYFMAKVGDQGRIIWKKADLGDRPVNKDFKVPDGPMFTVTDKDIKSGDQKLRFGLYEIWRGRWKGGLVIKEVEITPA